MLNDSIELPTFPTLAPDVVEWNVFTKLQNSWVNLVKHKTHLSIS